MDSRPHGLTCSARSALQSSLLGKPKSPRCRHEAIRLGDPLRPRRQLRAAGFDVLGVLVNAAANPLIQAVAMLMQCRDALRAITDLDEQDELYARTDGGPLFEALENARIAMHMANLLLAPYDEKLKSGGQS